MPCATTCHEGHELLDLYDKRDFTCDCDRGKGPDASGKWVGGACQLLREEMKKGDVSEETVGARRGAWPRNRYGQNFGGRYCVCHSEYNEEEERAMVQCSGCQDWFHQGAPCVTEANAGVLVAGDTSSLGFICAECMVSTGHRLLAPYIAAVGQVVPIDSQTGPRLPEEQTGGEPRPAPPHDAVAPGTTVSLTDTHPAPDSPFRSVRVHLYGNFADVLCHCEVCRAAFAQVGWEHLLDELVDVAVHESDDDSQVDEEEQAHVSSLLSQVVNSLPQDGVARRQVADVMSDFVAVFGTLRGEITSDDVPAIMEQVRARKRAREEGEGDQLDDGVARRAAQEGGGGAD